MSSLGSPNPFFIAGKKAYEIERSLRFNRSDGAYLETTLGNSNVDKWTWSGWVKKTVNGQHQNIFSSGSDSVVTMINFDNNDKIKFQNWHSGQRGTKITTRIFRDNSAWMHIVAIWDSGNSTADDRIRIYVNGTRETSFSSSSNPDQNQDSVINGNTLGGSTYGEGKHFIGRFADVTDPSGTYKTEINFIDGQAYDPSYFGETDAITGQWNPKKYTGSYGTNGFYLNFSDNSGTTATTLGKDSSGNGNNFTPNNFSVSAGDGNDSVTDTPTLNKATLNPLTGFTYNATLSEGNLKMSGSNGFTEISTIAFAGTSKFYYEVVNTERNGWQLVGVFVGQPNNPSNVLSDSAIWGFASTQATYFGGSYTSTSDVPSWTNNDVMAIKYENGSLKLYKNGTLQTANTSSVPTGDIVFAYIANDNQNAAAFVRFNSDSWTQASAAGVDSTWELSTANLPDPTILLPNKHFDTLLYTGNNYNGTRAITGYNFQPDWIWTKNRTAATSHHIYDEVRGLGSGKEICSDKTQAEGGENGAAYGYMTRYGTGGFNVVKGSDSTNGNYNLNINSNSYAAWAWNAGDTDGKTYAVTVVSDSGNKYRFDGFGTSAVTLDLAEGGTYIFDQSDASNATHPLRFYTAADKTGGEYTTGITTAGTPGQAGAYTQIVVAASAPTLYYQCSAHANMGGQANTNSTLGSSNFDGTIQSIVKVNATAGFSIVTHAGTGQPRTIGHGLGVAPQVIITKSRDSTDNWMVGHNSAGSSPWEGMIALNSSGGIDSGSTYFYDAAPTSTVFTRGNYSSGDDMIAYCFSEVAGYSKFGGYTGNGNADGTFVFTGFRPAWVLIKNSSSGSTDWILKDATIETFNVVDAAFKANTSEAEASSLSSVDFLSNGFKIRNTGSFTNTNGNTYIYLAFAESPFKNARAR